MLETRLKIKNFYWVGDRFAPPVEAFDFSKGFSAVQELHGQFAFACSTSEGRILLMRDRLGVNKLFFALHESGRVLTTNYLVDLIDQDVPYQAIFSVPSGHVIEIDVDRRMLLLRRYHEIRVGDDVEDRSLDRVASALREHLEIWFSRLAEQFGSRRICLCLSGGLDSGLVAALARKHFPGMTAYTYGYMQDGQLQSEDAVYARRLAEFLEIPFRFVPATAEDVLSALRDALVYGQDWRDFNVHCAVVNELIGRAIEADLSSFPAGQAPLLLTGDMMNEFLADYTPIVYSGREYYSLPRLPFGALRSILVRGLDSGDREVGVFNSHGLDIIQPYGLVADHYLRLPNALVCERKSKQTLVRAVAGDLLPPFIFEREKVRAQIGSSGQPRGILPLLVDTGRDSTWLKKSFCDLFRIGDESFLDQLILMGRYRFVSEYPDVGHNVPGFYT